MKSMVKLWGKKVNDLAFSTFVKLLEYKTNVVKINRFEATSKTCSNCLAVNESINKELKNLKNRVFECINCNFRAGRDLNASLNIYRVGHQLMKEEM